MKKLLIIIAIILFAVNGFATDYYICIYDSGEDNGDGTAAARPSGGPGSAGCWNGIEGAESDSYASTVGAGDTVYLIGTFIREVTGTTNSVNDFEFDYSETFGTYITYRGDHANGTGIWTNIVKDSRADGMDGDSWSQVYALPFDGGQNEPTIGDTLDDDDTASGFFVFVNKTSGDWATNDAAGVIYIAEYVEEFADDETIDNGGTTVATVNGSISASNCWFTHTSGSLSGSSAGQLFEYFNSESDYAAYRVGLTTPLAVINGSALDYYAFPNYSGVNDALLVYPQDSSNLTNNNFRGNFPGYRGSLDRGAKYVKFQGLHFVGNTSNPLITPNSHAGLLTDPGFAAWTEDDLDSWTENNCDAAEDTGQSGSGAKITTSASNGYIYQTVNVTAGQSYFFKGYSQKTAGDTPQFSIYDVSNSADITAWQTLESDTGSFVDLNFFNVFETPVGCTQIQIRVGAAGNGDIVWFDSLVLEPSTEYLTYDTCTFHSAYLSKKSNRGGYSNITVQDSTFDGNESTSGGFIYNECTSESIYYNWVIQGNLFKDMGSSGDAHAMGFQGGTDEITITKNEITNCGSGIVLYVSSCGYQTNYTISYNYVHGLDGSKDNSEAQGIAMQGGAYTSDRSGIVIHNNVVADPINLPGTDPTWEGIGIRVVAEDGDFVKVYNNTVNGYATSFECELTDGCSWDLRNNISNSPTLYHVSFKMTAFDSSTLTNTVMDYNSFYPISGDDFYFYDSDDNETACTYAEFDALENSNGRSGSMANDQTGDTLLSASYRLLTGSPAIDAGVDLGSSYDDGLDPASSWPDSVYTYDQDNNGLGWEIGAFIYFTGNKFSGVTIQ